MSRDFFLGMAASGAAFPIAADLCLHEEGDPEQVRLDPQRLSAAVLRTASTFRAPLAIPLMDLEHAADPQSPYWASQVAALRLTSKAPGVYPAGMVTGPFSLLTRLMKDPITAVALSGRGTGAESDAATRLLDEVMEAAEHRVTESVKAQIAAGARCMLVCEPAASIAYFSPRQIKAGSTAFERYVMAPNRHLKDLLDQAGVDLFFHNCGELTAGMVSAFGEQLHPAVLSLGSSRRLWEDAARVPDDTVLYGNLPTKTFYSDDAMPVEEAVRFARDLRHRMTESGHPFIAGSECDVLAVEGRTATIREKLDAALEAVR